jgi:hypothetical protein
MGFYFNKDKESRNHNFTREIQVIKLLVITFYFYFLLFQTIFTLVLVRHAQYEAFYRRLHMELDLQSLFGLHVHCAQLYSLDLATRPLPPAFGLIFEGAIGQPR